MATTLTQYWQDETTRIAAALAAHQLVATDLRTQLLAAQAAQRDAADALAAQAKALADARRALAGIPVPADGDPLLVAMSDALAGLAQARATQGDIELQVQQLRADIAREDATTATLAAQLKEAKVAGDAATAAATTRQVYVDRLATGSLATLAADAAAALAANAATAAARVESEFPQNATDAKNFLKRVRARRALVASSATQAAAVDKLAFDAAQSALAQAQRDFDVAAAAVQSAALSAPRFDVDTTTLAGLAALPAPNPPSSYPILSPSEHAHLNDAALAGDREDALAKLTDVDDAQSDVCTAQTAYDTALLAALKAAPDATIAQLDAGPLNAQRTTLDGKIADLGTAQAALSAAELATLQAWFADVPDVLWDALEGLDTAVARLTALAGPPTPANLITSMTNAETALVTALGNARTAAGQATGALRAQARSDGLATAEAATAEQRARAYARSSALF